MNSKLKVAFDIDGTLIHDERNPRICDTPRHEIILIYLMLRDLGCKMYIWSGGGIDYAQRWAEKLGLMGPTLISAATIIEKGSMEMDIVFDDEDVKLGKVNIRV
jgi:hydroxymethylpyrimidine pyrophosphatase-like HAD family hydrolase